MNKLLDESSKYIEEEITLYELAERFLDINDFKTPNVYDMSDTGIEILSKNLKTNEDEYKPIKTFVVKEQVDKYYTDGKLEGTENHRIIENNNEVFLKEHDDFSVVDREMDVVDVEVEDNKNYYANGRLNHNTTSGGKAPAFHSSVRLRLKHIGAIKDTNKKIIGIKVDAKIIKNRIGPPLKTCSLEVYFKSGIDNDGCTLNTLKEYKVLSGTKRKYIYTDSETKEKIEFTDSEFRKMMFNSPDFKEKMLDELSKVLIDKYKPKDIELLSITDEETEIIDEVID